MLPISELRGGIPLAFSYGYSPLQAFLICVASNLIIIPILFFFLDYIHTYLIKIKFYQNQFERYIHRSKKKLEKHVGTKWEYVFLFLLVAIPLPFTGAYTGIILSWFFQLKRKKSYLSIVLGVITAGIIVTLLTKGVINIL
jgi:uncharacterized membrane protein